jgi:hypothetical protein
VDRAQPPCLALGNVSPDEGIGVTFFSDPSRVVVRRDVVRGEVGISEALARKVEKPLKPLQIPLYKYIRDKTTRLQDDFPFSFAGVFSLNTRRRSYSYARLQSCYHKIDNLL